MTEQKEQVKLVILESPYKGQVEENLAYAKKAALDCCHRGESPQASHLLFTQFLDDTVPEQRELGIKLGLAWTRVADYSVFYTDRGWSTGMLRALDTAYFRRKQIYLRAFGEGIVMPIIHNQEQWDWVFLHLDNTKVEGGKV